MASSAPTRLHPLAVFLLIAGSLLCTACEEPFEFGLDHDDPRISIDAELRQLENGPPFVRAVVVRSAGFFSPEEMEFVADAQITLRDGQGNEQQLARLDTVPIIDSLAVSGSVFGLDTVLLKGTYAAVGMPMVPGRTYTLEVRVNDEVFTAQTPLKARPEPDSVVWSYKDEPPFFESDFFPTVFAKDDPNTRQNYIVQFYQDGQLIVNPAFIFYGDDEFLNDNQLVLEIPAGFNPQDTVTLELLEVDRTTMEFYGQFIDISLGSGSPFDGPPSNPKGNFSNGGLGLFRAVLPWQQRTILPEEKPDEADEGGG